MSETPMLYRLITALIALTSSASLFLTGELNPILVIPGLAMIPGYYRHIRGSAQAPRWVIGSLSAFTLVIVIIDTTVVSRDFFIAVAHMTLFFQAIKSFDLKEPWDPLQVYFMSLLQLVIISELSLSIWVGIAFLAFLIMILSAIVLTHFIKEGSLRRVNIRRPIIFVSVSALILTLIFFIAIPRVKGGMYGRKSSNAIKTVGFSEEVNFGSFGRVLDNPAIVMRAELSGKRQPLYWRGLSLDQFDGYSWKDSLKRRKRIWRREGRYLIADEMEKGDYTVQRIILEPMDTDVIFGLGGISAVKAREKRLTVDSGGSVFLPGKNNRRTSYTVFSLSHLWRSKGELWRSRGDLLPYLQIPQGLSPKIATLAHELTVDIDSDREKANRVEKYLKDNYEYSLKVVPPPDGIIPIEDFLFYSKRGFCEHYATAMVLMLRYLDIPARIVTGYAGGEVNNYGDYVILRQKNAHSWVEAAVNGEWTRFDPTPKSRLRNTPMALLYIDSLRMKWLRYVIGFSSNDQIRILRSFTMPVISAPDIGIYRINFTLRPLYVILVIASIVPVIIFGRKISLKRYPAETRAYLKFRKMVKKRGGSVRESSTPAEVMCEAIRLHVDTNTARELIDRYESVRFGGLHQPIRICRSGARIHRECDVQ